MDLKIKDRVALVLASTAGLGAATARALAAEGAHVVITGRNAERAERLAASLPSATAVPVDLTEPRAVEHLLTATREAYGEPDIVVLNGPGPKPGAAADLDAEDIDTIGDLLLKTHVRLVKAVLPHMRAQGWGRILAIGSSGVQAPIPMLAASNIGRAGLAAYLKTLASEVAADGVTVNLQLPGRIATDRVAALDEAAAQRQGRSPDEVRAASEASIPAGRYGTPDEFGALAAFLCSSAASYITGTAVRCDGGMLAHL
ncbi:SDR family oxidoreductase [Mycolicibacterium smegmatis]|uniref:3-oxoacyl-[acyl-carrier-protein] reductase MabA n=3 Tax=Mycolicibacterium smegmatis TaxID=1772 RepID=I7FFG0_MYCS2|nr:SDR family oxidoreductase [Mycolicibacterium smegmatis]ABK73181.1 short chain dehydrogenase [Mycolicibacterium smegmatis MC2 155]AFP37603.1 Short-chain dehydrogenase/reductase SDR [Mycolicibacterium smegmatis MC2 155]AIU06405.1 3-oxoacyl-ACP reductase [Mycolicibacterium smegmatis MC2 155]AIU13030.1 3-oxoacyl-ACP reductase [Mycolicibacterium smegmatis]AIU19654.1 3-oxoacyl-ACP reductase [Mycolicibacterium smegmatis]